MTSTRLSLLTMHVLTQLFLARCRIMLVSSLGSSSCFDVRRVPKGSHMNALWPSRGCFARQIRPTVEGRNLWAVACGRWSFQHDSLLVYGFQAASKRKRTASPSITAKRAKQTDDKAMHPKQQLYSVRFDCSLLRE